MTYQVKFGDTWEDVEDPKELPSAPDSPQSVGWLHFRKDNNDMLARPQGWRKVE